VYLKEGLFMSVFVKSKTGSHTACRRNLIIASLIVVVLVCSCLLVYVFVIDNGGEVHVKNEVELVRAIDAVKIGESAVIVLDNDILCAVHITIPSHKDITLTSNGNNQFKLVGGAKTFSAIRVELSGVLVIDGICVTHVEGVSSNGVQNFGTFTMHSGEISGHFGASGVSNDGVFTMTGGKITNNSCYTSGGGVYNGGTFTMTGGEITGNKATNSGGGVANYGTFNWTGGDIFDNTANTDANVYYEP